MSAKGHFVLNDPSVSALRVTDGHKVGLEKREARGGGLLEEAMTILGSVHAL